MQKFQAVSTRVTNDILKNLNDASTNSMHRNLQCRDTDMQSFIDNQHRLYES